MSRPLLITDCDEVLLHMARHFRAWLDEAHAIDFQAEGGAFALTRREDGLAVPDKEVWPLLDGFFDTQMDRQTLAEGAGDALRRIAEVADIVILTNLQDWCHAGRSAQLAAHGIRHRVVCNQGGKGEPVARLAAEHGSSVTVFVDDLETHHRSVAVHAPDVFRLHMVAEPTIAHTIPAAPDAHVRIDQWNEAVEWVLARFRGEPLP
jgi:hypothetical protein